MTEPTDHATGDGATALRARDQSAADALADVQSVHVLEAHWWNNASFALPLLLSLVSLAIGAVTGSFEALGFGVFLLAVTALMFPVVMITWRRTPTAVVLTSGGVIALHEGRPLRELRWSDVARIERADYDNIRWRIRPREGDHLSIEAELTDLDGLIDRAHVLSGLPREQPVS